MITSMTHFYYAYEICDIRILHHQTKVQLVQTHHYQFVRPFNRNKVEWYLSVDHLFTHPSNGLHLRILVFLFFYLSPTILMRCAHYGSLLYAHSRVFNRKKLFESDCIAYDVIPVNGDYKLNRLSERIRSDYNVHLQTSTVMLDTYNLHLLCYTLTNLNCYA